MKGEFNVNTAFAVIFAAVVLAGGCRNSLEDEIRADFAKIPDYLLYRRHGCHFFVRYTYTRIADIPDETCRMKMLREFTDLLFSVDFFQYYPLENTGLEAQRKSLIGLGNALSALRHVSWESYMALRGVGLPSHECWEVQFRYLEQCKRYDEQIEKLTGIKSSGYDADIRNIEWKIAYGRDCDTISPDELAMLRRRFEEITGRLMRTREEFDAEMSRPMEGNSNSWTGNLR